MKRIQRQRTKGWQLPENCVYVGRPTAYGNPFTVLTSDSEEERLEAIRSYREWITGQPRLVAQAKRELAGKDLACWCREDQACHADVLLELIKEK